MDFEEAVLNYIIELQDQELRKREEAEKKLRYQKRLTYQKSVLFSYHGTTLVKPLEFLLSVFLFTALEFLVLFIFRKSGYHFKTWLLLAVVSCIYGFLATTPVRTGIKERISYSITSIAFFHGIWLTLSYLLKSYNGDFEQLNSFISLQETWLFILILVMAVIALCVSLHFYSKLKFVPLIILSLIFSYTYLIKLQNGTGIIYLLFSMISLFSPVFMIYYDMEDTSNNHGYELFPLFICALVMIWKFFVTRFLFPFVLKEILIILPYPACAFIVAFLVKDILNSKIPD